MCEMCGALHYLLALTETSNEEVDSLYMYVKYSS